MSNPRFKPDLQGLYRKYIVTDAVTGKEVDGATFTLRPEDPHARVALKAYADSVQGQNPTLADDLYALVHLHSEDGVEFELKLQHVDAVSEAVEKAIEDLFPIPIHDMEGNIVAYVGRDYDPGDRGCCSGPPECCYPPEPGWLHYRFLPVSEFPEIKEGKE